MSFKLYQLRSDFYAYSQMAELHHALGQYAGKIFDLDCSSMSWVDANMCACLGAIVFNATERMQVRFVGVSPGIETIFKKNNFYPELCSTDSIVDCHNTTMRYHCFSTGEIAEFQEYTREYFLSGAKGLPKMSDMLLRRFRESLWEVFENAVAHSETQKGIFACGQYFPQKHRLQFTITDLGVGIPARVEAFTNESFSAPHAINWAMSDSNTTRKVEDGKPGGIGLKLIQEFLKQNAGELTVVSGGGWWNQTPEGLTMTPLNFPYPGTAVSITINTLDSKHYYLAEELSPETIF